MAKINQQPPRAPAWPWGGPRSVRDKLVDRAQLDTRKAKKKGDARNPALASAALLDFIGPAHSADELRLPMPPLPAGHDADVAGFQERLALAEVAVFNEEAGRSAMEQSLAQLKVPPERAERLKALLGRERQMLDLVSAVSADVDEVERRRREEQAEETY